MRTTSRRWLVGCRIQARILTIQLIENLQRQEIDPIDRAKAGGRTAKEPDPPAGKKKILA